MTTTKIVYDVSGAISELRKLDRQTGRTGKKTESDMKGGARGLKSLEGALGRVNPKLGAAASNIVKVGAAAGPMGVAVGAAAAAGVALAASFVGIPDIMRDNIQAMKDFADATSSILDQQNRISSIQDAQRNRQFRDLRDDVDTRRSDLDAGRAAANEAKLAADAQVAANREALRGIESDLKASIARQKGIRSTLQEGVIDSTVAQTGSNLTQGGRVNLLALRANKAAREGNLELARAMTEEARKLTQELGNHPFFLNQIESAENQIKKNLENRDRAESQLQSKLKARQSAAKQALEQSEKEKKVLEDRIKLLEIESSKIGSLRKEAKVAQRTEGDAQLAAEASREEKAALTNLQNFLKEGRSGFRNLADAGNFLRDLADPRRTAETITEDAREVGQGQKAIVEGLRDAFRDGKLTISEIEGLNQIVEGIETGLRDLKATRPGQELASSVQTEEQRLNAFAEQIKKLGDAAIKGGDAGVGANQSIQIRANEIQVEADRLNSNLEQSRQRILPQQQTAPTTPTAPLNQQASNVSLNVEIQGGMLDEETMAQIETRFKRLIREERSSGLA